MPLEVLDLALVRDPVFLLFFLWFHWISESVFLLAVSLDSSLTVKRSSAEFSRDYSHLATFVLKRAPALPQRGLTGKVPKRRTPERRTQNP